MHGPVVEPMTNEVASPAAPAPSTSRPVAPRWAPLLVAVVAGLGVAAFVVGLVPITYVEDPTPPICVDDVCVDANGRDTVSEECGSLFLPNVVWTHSRDECAGALLPLRITEGLLTVGAVVLGIAGAKRSGSVGRNHTRAWDAFLVCGVLAAFLLVWMLAAWPITHLLAMESS
jgi:hypothetical protein